MHIEELDKLQAAHNEGRGITCVRGVIFELKQGNAAGAKVITSIDWDKIANYPDVAAWLKASGLAEADWYINDF